MHVELMEAAFHARLGILAAILFALTATAAAAAEGCVPAPIGEFGGSARPLLDSPRRPEIHFREPGNFCLAEDVRQEKLMDPRTGREMTTVGGEGIVLVGADDVHIDLGGHRISNDRTLGYTLIKHYNHEPGRPRNRKFLRTWISNGSLISPGSRGVAVRLTGAGVYDRQGFGKVAVPSPDKGTTDIFADTSHFIEGLTIFAGKRAIEIDGWNNVIRNNRIIVEGVTAIVGQGPGVVIEDNDIEIRGNLGSLTPHDREVDSLTPFPIRLIQADGAIVRNNRIRFVAAGPLTSLPAAIQLTASGGVVIEENWIGGLDAVVQADDASSVSARDNRLVACPAGEARFLPPGETGDQRPVRPVCRQAERNSDDPLRAPVGR